MTRIGWLDCSSGVSGDMLLGALADLGALDGFDAVVAALPGVDVRYEVRTVDRAGLRARHVVVTPGDPQPERRLADVVTLLDAADVPDRVRSTARDVFERLATAEAAVHGTTADDVHFHEVGAVDAIVDVLGACLGMSALGLAELTVSPVALGGGTAAGAHGALPVPAPAVLQLLAGSSLPSYGGPADHELATPTGVALVATLARPVAAMPAMTVAGVGVGAGTRDLAGRPNVVRLVVGEPVDAGDPAGWSVLEANVDDLDPRLWPAVLDALFAAGAADAWLTPILMKKGRPAHTVGALVAAADRAAVEEALFRHTSTIGVRGTDVVKTALDRDWVTVDVDGQPIRVKVATRDGEVVTATPEWEDVAAAARASGRPAKAVLAAAVAAFGRRDD